MKNAEANPGNKIYNRQFDQRNAHHRSSFVHIEHDYEGSQQDRTCDLQTGAYRLHDVSNALLHSYAYHGIHTDGEEVMVVLHIEHAIRDFDTWKAAFERDPVGRRQSGVVRYWVRRPRDDRNYISIDLEFATVTAAEKFVDAMQVVWGSKLAGSVLAGKPHTRIFDQVEYLEY